MPVDPDELVALGVVAKPHGIRGELRVKLFNPDSPLLDVADEVVLRQEGEEPTIVTILARRREPDMIVLKLEDVTDRDAADALRGAELCLPRAAFPPIEEGEYYQVDLIGCRVQDERGKDRGEVIDVINYPTTDVLRVREGDVEREVPILEPYFVSADVTKGIVVLNAIDDFEPEMTRKKR